MGIISALRRRIGRSRVAEIARIEGEAERLQLAAEIPLGGTDTPLWKIDLQLVSEPQADGEKLRLRAHIQTNLASALRAALAGPPDARPALPPAGQPSQTLVQRAGAAATGAARRVLAVPVIGRMAEPLLRLDFNTWIELQASTASLDAGAGELLPQAERLAALGIRPRRLADQMLAESWAGEAPNGFAQVSVVQVDKKHLPPRLAQLLGDKPFQLAAAIVNTVEEK